MRKSGFSFFRRRRCANALRLQALSLLFLVAAVLFFVPNGFAQEAYQSPSTPEASAEAAVSALKKLRLEELVDTEITEPPAEPPPETAVSALKNFGWKNWWT
jgi:hypothetical protein